MSKTPITWLELVNMKLKARKAKGESASVGDVSGEAKKEWTQIKSGTHPQYVQGKATFAKRTKKSGHGSGAKTTTRAMRRGHLVLETIFAHCKECPKCSKAIKAELGGMSGGSRDCTALAAGNDFVGATADEVRSSPASVSMNGGSRDCAATSASGGSDFVGATADEVHSSPASVPSGMTGGSKKMKRSGKKTSKKQKGGMCPCVGGSARK